MWVGDLGYEKPRKAGDLGYEKPLFRLRPKKQRVKIKTKIKKCG